MYGDILQYIAHAILLKCENVCNIDIAGPNIAKMAIILPNPSVCMCVRVRVCVHVGINVGRDEIELNL